MCSRKREHIARKIAGCRGIMPLPGRGAEPRIWQIFLLSSYSLSGPVMTPVTAEAAATEGLER